MSNSSRRSNKQRISYVEVDSDVDLDSDREGDTNSSSSNKGKGKVKKSSGDTYGTTEGTTRSKKRARKSTGKKSQAAQFEQEEEEEEQPVYDPKLLLDMPFDIFAETCSHLEGADLISFAQVNKHFRRILLSQSAQTIWTTRRMSDGYPLPEDRNELQFAMFIYGKTCQGCGDELDLYGNHQRNSYLRCHICHNCRESLLISSLKIDTEWTDLHPQATECVRSETEEYGRRKTLQLSLVAEIYLIDELDEVDQTLKELEDEDEAIQAERDKVKYTSSTRSRPKKSVDLPEANKVRGFVRARQEWVEKEKEISSEIIDAMEECERAMRATQQQEQLKRRGKIIEARDYLGEFGGWLDDELEWFYDERSYYTPTFGLDGIPGEMPQDDPEPWEAYHSQIQEEIAKSEEEEARRIRQVTVELDYHSQAIEVVEDPQAGLIVDPHEFVELATVRPLWKPDGADSSQEAFNKLLPSIVKQIQEHQEKSRVKAVRSILASNAGVPISNYSLKSSDYPSDQYDSDFFELATSVFYTYSPGALTFPELVEKKQGLSWLRNGISLRQKDAVLAMLEAAELNPATATWNDLIALGQRFKWETRPFKSRRPTVRGLNMHYKADWNCNSLLIEIMRDGPKNKEIEAGKGVDIELSAVKSRW